MAKSRILRGLALVLIVAAVACGGSATAAPKAQKPAAASPDAALKAGAERFLSAVNPPLATLVREQPWYAELTPSRLALIEAVQKCEKTAQPKGETQSVTGILTFASEQTWYLDGLDDREATVMAGVFEAYASSLEDNYAPQIGPILANTLRQALFEVVNLPESGPMVVMVAAERLELGQKALQLAVDALPGIEAIVGKYPYHFLHIQVTKDLPTDVLGASYDEFMEVDVGSVYAETVIHEITHSTLYGSFPTWFEEGFAHFMEYYVTGTLDAGERDFTSQLRRLGRDPALDIRATRGKTFADYIAERARGFLFLKAVHDAIGIENMSKMLRNLRTRTYGDQDLMRAMLTDGSPESQALMAQVVCKQVIGTVRSYCR
ncbi:MAG TPA: hypothetical protein VJB57_01390 [Dehalococcoidia bacterium]|nr:hypothetical protein [Dehalococcoidia bacterium]